MTEPTGSDAAASGKRAVRVFISSTFRDMQRERDELVKFVFPLLRRRCAERGVTWGEVDLRWGIPDEQKGEVLATCLAEIERCRPYFIGLLGERYGWVPEEIESDLVEQEAWLPGYTGRSMTELEIMKGVLKNPDMASHAFFYLRDPAYIDTRPGDEQPELRELPLPEEIHKFGAEEAERRAQERRRKLVGLKERIRNSGFSVGDYPGPEALGELVLRDLTEVIDRLYPEGSAPDPLEREAAEHEAFAESRARVYVGRAEYIERLDAHAAGDGPPLVVLGESGAGKSALLATWAQGYRASHPDEFVMTHFVSSSPYSSDWRAMLRRIIGELGRRFGIEGEIPDTPEQLRLAFAQRLHVAAAQGRVVLVIDALNQLEDRDGAPDLIWLPPVVPANVRLVFSTLPGRPLDALGQRGWPTLQVDLLTTDERKTLVAAYLGQYTKELSLARVGRIVAAPQTANPLYLRALLEELRLWGTHETLDQPIDHYLAAETVGALYTRILERYESDYERSRPGLVCDAMSLIWAARRGLSEAELRDLLGSNGEPLPSAHWSPLSLAAEQSLVNRSGLIGFSHAYFRRAVEVRYLPGRAEREAVHLRLADYFDARRQESRGIDELPWQLAEAAAWQRLCDLLGDLAFFERAFRTSESEVKAHWARVEANSSLRMVDAYRSMIGEPEHAMGSALGISKLLIDTGHLPAAHALLERYDEQCRVLGDRAGLQLSLGNRATILVTNGELDEAISLLREQERICRELGNPDGLHRSLGNQAVVLQRRGELGAAVRLQREKERICRELGDQAGLQLSLGNQGQILTAQGELDAAMVLLHEQERICHERGDQAGLQDSLGNQAAILLVRGELDGATALLREQERICRGLGHRAGLATALGNQALIHRQRRELGIALALLEQVEGIFRELGDVLELSKTLVNRGMLVGETGRAAEALALIREGHRIAAEHGLSDEAGQFELLLTELTREIEQVLPGWSP